MDAKMLQNMRYIRGPWKVTVALNLGMDLKEKTACYQSRRNRSKEESPSAMARHGLLTILPLQTPEGVRWVRLACPTPVAELSHIDPAVSGFAAVDPGLRAIQNLTNLSLRQASFLAQPSEKRRDRLIAFFMLGLGSH
jgi:hypothetical protein